MTAVIKKLIISSKSDLVPYELKDEVDNNNDDASKRYDQLNKKETDFNLYDKFFTYYFYFKSTMVKYYALTGQYIIQFNL